MDKTYSAQTRTPTPTDHLALKTLIKYMSSILGIPYKLICDGTRFNESTVKNYVNDKAVRGRVSTEIFSEFSHKCAELISRKGISSQDDNFLLHLEEHLFGDQWINPSVNKPPDQRFQNIVAQWLDVPDGEVDHLERRYAGLWRILRFSPRADPHLANNQDRREINLSLLHIHPKRRSESKLLDFRSYHLDRGHDPDEYNVMEGLVIPRFDRVDFLGRASRRHKVLTLTSWRSIFGPEVRRHAKTAYGLTLTSDTWGRPIATRVRAFFIDGSADLLPEKFESLRKSEMRSIGTKRVQEIRSLIPEEHLDRTLDYLAGDGTVVGFVSDED